MRIAAILWILLAALASSAASGRATSLAEDRRCETDAGDRRWLLDAWSRWRTVRQTYLKARDHVPSQIVAYDLRCSYSLGGLSGSKRWSITAHHGEIVLPNGGKIPPAPNAFNAARGAGSNFVVMSLPSIWRTVAPKSEIPLEWILEGILLHEMSHAYQSRLTPELSFPALQKRWSLPSNVTDDSVQEAFKLNTAYVRDYQLGRDLLFRAAAAPNNRQARRLACEALGSLRTRRARHFVGSNAYWAAVDELSLTTEGLGEWVSYTWLTKRRGLSPSLVLSKVRGSYWSQEQGLALFLTIDRLVPGWQRRLLSKSPVTADRLLALACGRRAQSIPSRQ